MKPVSSSLKSAAFIVGAAVAVFGIGYFALGAWQEPTQAPPQGNPTFNASPWVKTGNDIYYNTGNVGIGTTGPGTELDVQKFSAGSTIAIRSYNSDNTNGSSHARLVALVGGASAGDPYVEMTVSGGTNWVMGVDNDDSDKLKIGPVGTPSAVTTFAIDTTGNVGIGTTGPGFKLDVSGDVNLGGSNRALFFRRPDGTTESGKFTTTAGSEFQVLGTNSRLNMAGRDGISLFTDNTFTTERVRIDTTGNVGIGTTAPSQSLEVANNANPWIRVTRTNAALGTPLISLNNQRTSGREYSIQSTSTDNTVGAGRFVINDQTSDTSRLVIDSTGNVGIGTTSPSERLHIIGGNLRLGSQADGARNINFGMQNGQEAGIEWFGFGDLGGGSAAGRIGFTRSANWGGTFKILTGRPGGGGVFGSTFFGVVDAPAGYPLTNQHLSVNTNGVKSEAVLYVNSTGNQNAAVFIGGNVGIGTTGPGTILDVRKATAAGTTYADIRNSATDGAMGWRATNDASRFGEVGFGGSTRTDWFKNSAYLYSSNGGWSIVADGTNAIRFLTQGIAASNERVRIDSAGNVGIGTTNPQVKLEVNGGVRMNTTDAKPACGATTRGTLWFTQGSTNDDVEVCILKNSSYIWKNLVN